MIQGIWPNVYFVSEEDAEACAEAVKVIESVLPEVPPPVWDERRIDPAACVAATKALCG